MAINPQDGALRTVAEKGGTINDQDGSLRTLAEKEESAAATPPVIQVNNSSLMI